ncbi:diguanylate cyclase [Yoonia sediminilitoris]|uniref:diguanylate cyclase n=1 Tax=Yoonia sediminilitoris TaxID=1286148 RepID=A0A2T6KB47_9RHOB|nr:diguanylate cyclase [Yoonia sediminilitoris]PUB12095.1 response regulator receiver modulated diguanylate cyclase [Yoonia sediminilitoris]RCW92922.1 response regulator receiver modulated diguanylate cyclase [Yoonia sediminilitoris]
MSGRILIIDTVATNLIVLKVKMLSAQFNVDACSSRIEAEAIITTNRPDMILINLSDPVEDRHEFCRALKSSPATSEIAVIAVGVADTARARFAALDAGADDVLPHPTNDTFLLARIRSLLRVRSTTQELLLRESTSRVLGFEEAATKFETAVNVALLSPAQTMEPGFSTLLQGGLRQPIRHIAIRDVLKVTAVAAIPDLFVIDCTSPDLPEGQLFGLVSDLRSRSETRSSTQLVIMPSGQPHIAAMVLDLGADDVVDCGVTGGELTLRAKALIRRKLHNDRLRVTLRDGLHAAVTDPLTGLYNRRYVESHLPRLAQETHEDGSELAIMMLDIDHFKSVNDTYGHTAGDKVLVQMADRLRQNLRGIDLVARVGGEEFLVALPGTTPRQAHVAADRLRRLVNARPFQLGKGQPPLRLTVSVGVAIGSRSEGKKCQLDQMYDEADAALYTAKTSGRNRVSMSLSAA